MANLNAPSGLAPVQYLNANVWNGQARMYVVLAADTNAYYIGDPVKSTANCDAYGIPAVTLGTAGATLRGVVVGIGTNARGGPFINPNDLTKISRPSGAQSVNYYLAVVDDPDVVFEIQEISTGTAGVAANIGSKNANFVYGAPATGVFISGVTVDNTTYATTSTLNFRMLGAVQRLDNTPFTASQRLLVKINNHDFSGGTTAV